jgi:hypothetical protein
LGGPQREPYGKQAGEGTERFGVGNLTLRESPGFSKASGKDDDPGITEDWPEQRQGREEPTQEKEASRSTQEKTNKAKKRKEKKENNEGKRKKDMQGYKKMMKKLHQQEKNRTK